jgi:hypothetical protein
MNCRKPTVGLVLILVTLSTLINYPLVHSASPPTVQTSLEDINDDGLTDLKFRVINGIDGIPGVKVDIFMGERARSN